MNKLKLAYFGTPDFSARFLEKLLTDPDSPVEVTLVVTQPDRPAGRNNVLSKSPVKVLAEKFRLPIATLLHLPAGRQGGHPADGGVTIEQFNNVDLALVYAFGEILPKKLLEAPRYGFWNVHPSLLPLYRGPSPMATPLIEGATETGVTLIKMDAEVDHGPIIAQEKVAIEEKDKRLDLEKKLTDLGYSMFKIAVKRLTATGDVLRQEQDHDKATFTKRMSKEDGFVPISNFQLPISNKISKSKTMKQFSNVTIYNLFRGLYPWPGIWSKIRITRSASSGQANKELRIKITDMDLVGDKLQIKKIQIEGKKEVDFETFRRAYPTVL